MNNLFARLLPVAGVLFGGGGFITIKFILQDDATSIPQKRTETAQGDEQDPTSVGGTDADESDSNITLPTRVDHLVFPKRTFERKASTVSWVATLSDDELLSWFEQSTEPTSQVSQVNRTELQTTLL